VWSFVVEFKVVACVAVKCDHVLCPVQFLFLQKMTDFKEQCICIKLFFFSHWQNWSRFLSDVNICFQRGSNVADCSI